MTAIFLEESRAFDSVWYNSVWLYQRSCQAQTTPKFSLSDGTFAKFGHHCSYKFLHLQGRFGSPIALGPKERCYISGGGFE